MKIVFEPAVYSMRSLRLLPKFSLISLILMVPLLCISALLVSELNHSIALSHKERMGVQVMRSTEQLLNMLQQHRALRHMMLNGNAHAGAEADRLSQSIENIVQKISADKPVLAALEVEKQWGLIKSNWQTLTNKGANIKAPESNSEHTALIAHVYKFTTLISDRANLTLDPEANTANLIKLFVKTIPEVTEGLAEIYGRGAAFIDTGLLEANEDVMLNAAVMIAQRDLVRIRSQLESMLHENAEFQTKLSFGGKTVNEALAFLERARNEVLRSYNQTSGEDFYRAGSKASTHLFDLADESGLLLDQALVSRIEKQTHRRNLIVGGILLSVLLVLYLLLGFFISFTADIKALSYAVERASGGDLSHRVSSSSKDEIGALQNAFLGMNSGLSTMVEEVRGGISRMAYLSRDIASGNAHLSSRTAEQAASLEQTAALMGGLIKTVQKNSENAHKTEQLVKSASEVALKGGRAFEQVMDTMGLITKSSGKIGEIIGVIDTIAFQTNLLALNAAVEAAHAGEYGRGFATVATEIRSLAQRSATAAREVKSLILDSMEKVDLGSQKVREAGSTMQNIIHSVKQVSDIMLEISAASQDQRAGIENVNQAIVMMEEITQHNAALVVQASAATEDMHIQAVHVLQAVSMFKLEHANHAAHRLIGEMPVTESNIIHLS